MAMMQSYNENISLKDMGLSHWQGIQDSISEITGLPLGLFDTEGNPLSSVSKEDKLTKVVMKSPQGNDLYHNFYKESIDKAFKTKDPLILRSPLNQQLFIVPLSLDTGDNVAIIGGHSFFTSRDISDFTKKAHSYGVSLTDIAILAKDMVFSDFNVLSSVSRFVSTTANSLINLLKTHQELSKDIFRYKTLLEITLDLSLHPFKENSFQEVFYALSLLFDVDSCSLMIRDEADREYLKTLWAHGRIKDKINDLIVRQSGHIIREAIKENKPIFSDNLNHIAEAGCKEGVESIAFFPLLKDYKIFALLTIFNTNLSNEDMKVVQAFCKHLSFIIENQGVKRELVKNKKDINKLGDVHKTLANVMDTEELYRVILDKSIELLRAEQGSLMLLNEAEELIIESIKGINRNLIEHLTVGIGEGVSGKVFESAEPLIVKDIENDRRFKQKNRPRYKTKSFISIPLKVNSRTIGVLNISDKITGKVFSEDDLHLLQSFASSSSVAIERSELFEKTEELKEISITDSLTGLLNRRYFQERLIEEVERSKRHGQPFSFIMIDIDDFKAFNDSRGHMAGDEALKRVSKAMKDTVRTIDVVSRYGGEEFSVILPQTNKERSLDIAERLRKEIDRLLIFPQTDEFPEIKLTVSLGLATFPHDTEDLTELINDADKALYRAKARGKNRVTVYTKEGVNTDKLEGDRNKKGSTVQG